MADAGYDVTLIVGDGRGNEVRDGVQILDIGAAPPGRLARMRHQPRTALAALLDLSPALVHFHDPELLPVGWYLARRGVRVIYDAHEDVPRQILNKDWLPSASRRPIAWSFELFETRVARSLTTVIGATPHIRDRFSGAGCHSIDIKNFPLLREFETIAPNWENKDRVVCYIGGIERRRGIVEMVRALAGTEVRLLLAGSFKDDSEPTVSALPGWRSVDLLGHVGRPDIAATLSRSMAGLVVLHPIRNYVDSMPIKMFEYMAAGIPVIASHFPTWRAIIDGNDCGICVDPFSPEEIAEAIRRLVSNPLEARRLGANGRAAVIQRYNWETESKALLELYGAKLVRG